MPITPMSRSRQFLSIFTLGLAAFIFNTTEFVPVGLLTHIAQDFDMSAADAGWMMTVYAWVVAGMSLPMMLMTKNIERKRLLLISFAVFVGCHILTVVAPSFEILLLSRIGIALSHAIFWSITVSIAIRLAPPDKKALALSCLASGTSLAMVLGVPLGRIIDNYLGWRATFAVIGIAALFIGIAIFVLFPQLPSLFKGSIKTLPLLMKQNEIKICYLFIFLIFAGHYTAYSYIEPYFKDLLGFESGHITWLLLVFGSAGILGSIVFSKLGDKYATQLLLSQVALVALSICLLPLLAQSSMSLYVILIVWSAALMIVGPCMQVKLLALDQNAADMLMSLFSGIINLGIGAGALIGSLTIKSAGLESVTCVGSMIVFLSFITISYGVKTYTRLR